jgi:hypothetical protein
MLQETSVANLPAPVVNAEAAADGTVNLSVRYADAQTGNADVLSFSV